MWFLHDLSHTVFVLLCPPIFTTVPLEAWRQWKVWSNFLLHNTNWQPEKNFFIFFFVREKSGNKVTNTSAIPDHATRHVRIKRQVKKMLYLLHTMEMAMRETIKTTPAAADPAIRGSCSLSSDLKSSGLHKEKTDRHWEGLRRGDAGCVYLGVCL